MQESLVKVLVFFTALFSILIGGILMLFPVGVVEFTGATTADVGWLRSVGAGTLGFQGVGLLIAAFRRRDTNPLVGIAAFVTTLQAGTVWYSLFTGEYGELSRWAVVAVAILATVAAVLLWFAWLSRRKSLGGLRQRQVKQGAQGSTGQVSQEHDGAADADLIEEIDSQSPRLKE